ncbi:MAG: hypothetical protein K9N35_04790 [Candidatus Marinimicrobia bacterium]|nr:hypothetical protein [Candidatus Neomarinimicrobiota bacterium]
MNRTNTALSIKSARHWLIVGLIFLGYGFILCPQATLAQSAAQRNAASNLVIEKRATALIRMGRMEEAVDLYMATLYKNPKNLNYYYRLAELLPGKDNAYTLLQIVDDLLKFQTEDNNLLAEKGRLLYLLEQKQEALQVWYQIIPANPNQRFIYTTVSNAMLKAGAVNEAIDLLNSGRSEFYEPDLFAFDLARIYAAKHDYTFATKEYLIHLDRNPRMLDHIASQLIRLLENEGAQEAMEKGFDDALTDNKQHPALILARAMIMLHLKQYDVCANTVMQMEIGQSGPEVLKIANDLKNEGAWQPAAELYMRISSRSKDDRLRGEALLNLAACYDQSLNSKDSYESLADYFPGNSFLKLDLRIVPQNDGSLERTLKLYDSLQVLLPKTRQATMASYNIAEINLTVSADIDRASRGLEDIFKFSPYKDMQLIAGIRLVDAFLAKGDTSSAVHTLERVVKTLDLDEDDPVIIASRIKIFIHEGDVSLLLKELKNLSGSAGAAHPLFNDGMELQALLESNGGTEDQRLRDYLEAERLIGQHKLSQAIDILSKIEGPVNSITDEAKVRMIQLLLALDDNTRAQTEMDDFLKTSMDSPWRATVLVWRGEQFQFVDNDPQAAIPYYEELIVEHPEYLGIKSVRLRLRNILGTGS